MLVFLRSRSLKSTSRLWVSSTSPSSLAPSDAIQAVINIAKANPNFPVILQWTGGRGGGHHSFEDFHQPILTMYGRIRRTPNVLLVAGSGFGGADDTYPYLTGDWSKASTATRPCLSMVFSSAAA